MLEFQLRIRDGLITREEAIEFLSRSPEQIFVEENKSFSGQHTVRLGELLIRAGILSRSDVSNVLEVSLHTGKRMGELLIRYGFVNEQLLEAALNLQQMVDSAFLHVEQASATLRHVEQEGGTIASALVELNIITAPAIAVRPDSTFGMADAQKPAPIARSRTRRLLQTLRSDKVERLPQPMEVIYKRLVSAYTRLAKKHIIFENFDESVWLLERILAIKEQLYGPFHRYLVPELIRLSESHFALQEYEQARPGVCRAIEILENSQPYDGNLLACALNVLGSIYFEQELYADAEPFLSRALTLREMNLPASDGRIADTLRDYARLLSATNRQAEASKLYFQARAIVLRNKNEVIEAPTFFEKIYLDSVK
jgi:tetratricopeptide (TPR) repeat protein